MCAFLKKFLLLTPAVRGSNALKDPGSKLMFPYSCAQEACGCRDAAFIKEGVPVPLPNSTLECLNRCLGTPGSKCYKERCPDANSWELHHKYFHIPAANSLSNLGCSS